MEAGPLEAGVEEAVHQDEGTDGEEPGEEGQAEHGDEHVLPSLVKALGDGAHHGLHPHQGEYVAGDEEDQGREEEEEVEDPFGVRAVFLEADDGAGLGVALEGDLSIGACEGGQEVDEGKEPAEDQEEGGEEPPEDALGTEAPVEDGGPVEGDTGEAEDGGALDGVEEEGVGLAERALLWPQGPAPVPGQEPGRLGGQQEQAEEQVRHEDREDEGGGDEAPDPGGGQQPADEEAVGQGAQEREEGGGDAQEAGLEDGEDDGGVGGQGEAAGGGSSLCTGGAGQPAGRQEGAHGMSHGWGCFSWRRHGQDRRPGGMAAVTLHTAQRPYQLTKLTIL